MKLKQHNCVIDIFRLVCAIMVVAIHTHPFMDINLHLGFVFTDMTTRVGVPFFFGVAGYFYLQKLEAGKAAFWKYVKRLLLIYSAWTLLYYAVDFVEYGYSDIFGFVKSCVICFIAYGSCGHFWFFPAMIYTVIMVTVLWKMGGKKWIVPLGILLYGICCLGSGYYYGIGDRIPVLRSLFVNQYWELFKRIALTAFPFFGCGYLIRQLETKVKNNKTTVWFLLVATVLWLGEILLLKHFKLQRDIVTTPLLYVEMIAILLFLVKHPMPHLEKQANTCRVMANFTYYSHPFMITCISFLRGSVLNVNIGETPMFLITSTICLVLGWLVYKWNNKYVNYLI